MSKFSREKIFIEAWRIVKDNLSFFIGFTLFVSLVNLTPNIILNKYNLDLKDRQDLSFMIELISFVVQLIIGYLIVKISLLIVDGKEVNKDNLLPSSNIFFNYTIGTAVYGTIILLLLMVMGKTGNAGLIMFVPLILVFLKFQFVNYIIVDKKTTVISAFKISNEITKDDILELFLFILSLFMLNLLGALVFLVGLLLTIPISIISITLVYRELIKKVSFEREV